MPCSKLCEARTVLVPMLAAKGIAPAGYLDLKPSLREKQRWLFQLMTLPIFCYNDFDNFQYEYLSTGSLQALQSGNARAQRYPSTTGAAAPTQATPLAARKPPRPACATSQPRAVVDLGQDALAYPLPRTRVYEHCSDL